MSHHRKRSFPPMNSIVITAIFKPKEDKIEPFLEELKKVQEASRQEDGCLQYDLHQSMEDQTYVLYEVWKDNEAVEAHINTDHYKQYRDNTAELIESREVYKLTKMD